MVGVIDSSLFCTPHFSSFEVARLDSRLDCFPPLPHSPTPSRTFEFYFPLFLDVVMSLKQETIKLNQDQNSNAIN